MIKPGAGFREVVKETGEVNANDVLVFLAGTNDIACNERKELQSALRSKLRDLQSRRGGHVLVFSVPHRHDLPRWAQSDEIRSSRSDSDCMNPNNKGYPSLETNKSKTTNLKKIKMFLINICSLRSKLNQLELILSDNSTDVVCINEHWLSNDEIKLYVPSGFTLAASYCRSPPLTHGGSSILVKNSIKYSSMNVSNFCVEKVFEISAIKLVHNKGIIISVYRTPDSNIQDFLSKLEEVLNYITEKSYSFIAIAGDFNLNILELHRPEIQQFLNVMRSFNLYNVHSLPTRGKASLDNIYTCVKSERIECKLYDQDLISDHAGIFADLSVDIVRNFKNNNNETEIHKRRLITTNRLNNYKKCLSSYNWSYICNVCDTNSVMSMFINVLKSYFDIHCPVINYKPKSKSSQKNWYTPELKLMREHLMMLYNVWKITNTENAKVIFKNYKKQYCIAIDRAKIMANDDVICKSSNRSRAAWKIVKKEIGNDSAPQKINISPDILNDFFVNVPNTVSKDLNQSSVTYAELLHNFKFAEGINSSTLEFSFKVVKPETVISIVNNLSSSKSEDCFGLSNFILKNIIESILTPLTLMINIVLLTGQFPDCLKLSLLSPIFKKGDRELPENYRPIAIVPIISKIIEACIFYQMYEYFSINKLLNVNQFGFRPDCSTAMAVEKLHKLVNFILDEFEKRMVVGGKMLDLSKAFDI
ncbi:uncharacterized protein LOC120356382, partial [Nilaparvata lugens]|uniref:uncharacterized protein LOC120356382 n=1 Tax=Nilaparvata lugens TaxID=108931 RepID=UPI00193EBC86